MAEINGDGKYATSPFKIGHRIKHLDKRIAFITIKDRKRMFINNTSFQLINQTKTELCKICIVFKVRVTFYKTRTPLEIESYVRRQFVLIEEEANG